MCRSLKFRAGEIVGIAHAQWLIFYCPPLANIELVRMIFITSLSLHYRFDRCIDISLQRLVYGTLLGGVAGLVFFRTSFSVDHKNPYHISFRCIFIRVHYLPIATTTN